MEELFPLGKPKPYFGNNSSMVALTPSVIKRNTPPDAVLIADGVSATMEELLPK
jgi:hypothetical protein